MQAFIDISRNLAEPADLNALLQAIGRDMGFDHFALIHHVDLSPFRHELGHMTAGQLIALSDYPEQWIEEYISDEIVTHDPVLLASHRTSIGFAWSVDLPRLLKLKRPHIDQLERGKRAGIGDGFTIPANVPGEANGSCNFVVKTGRDLPFENLAMAQLVGSYAFNAARSIVTHAQQRPAPVKIAPRQIECIALVGKGKSDWEIAQVLGISEATVRGYIDDAKDRYQVAKRVQLVIRAIYDGHLALSDILR